MQIASSDFLRDEGKNGENPLWIFEYFPEISRKICTQALRATFAQGTAFYRMFGEQIPNPERKKCAYEFAKMSESNAVKRRFLALRYGFLKSGLVRNLALMFLI